MAVVHNQGYLHPLEMQDIIPGRARSICLHDKKLIIYLLSCVFFQCNLRVNLRQNIGARLRSCFQDFVKLH